MGWLGLMGGKCRRQHWTNPKMSNDIPQPCVFAVKSCTSAYTLRQNSFDGPFLAALTGAAPGSLVGRHSLRSAFFPPRSPGAVPARPGGRPALSAAATGWLSTP